MYRFIGNDILDESQRNVIRAAKCIINGQIALK